MPGPALPSPREVTPGQKGFHISEMALVYSSVKWETNVQQNDKGLAEILLEIKSAIQTPRFTKTFVQGICTDLQSRLTIVCHEEPSFGCPSRQGLTGSWPRAGLSLLRLFANEPVVSSST